MSNKININSNKSKSFGILIAILAVSLTIIMSIAITQAWFTDNEQLTKNSTAPSIVVSLVDGSNAAVTQETVATSSSTLPAQIKVMITSNVDVYVRVQINAFCFDSNGIRTDLEVSDYYNINTNTTDWGSVAGYNNNFIYYKNSGTGAIKLASNGNKLSVITTNTTSKDPLPSGVSLKLQVFAEAVQGNNTGLAKWVA